MRWSPDNVEDGVAACTLIPLQIVDAAFEHGGGSEERRFLRDEVCPVCPISHQCLQYALIHDEPGIWGGTTRKARTEARKRRAA